MVHSESLKKNSDFQKVYREGTSYANRCLVMYVLENQYNRNRLGISVSKKTGNSVVRHRITRLIREIYRLDEMRFKTGTDIVVIARPAAKGRNYHDLKKDFFHLAAKHSIILPEEKLE